MILPPPKKVKSCPMRANWSQARVDTGVAVRKALRATVPVGSALAHIVLDYAFSNFYSNLAREDPRPRRPDRVVDP